MLRRWVIVVGGVLVAFVVLSLALTRITPEPVRSAITQPGPVVVVGLPGAQWADVTQQREPGLSALLQIAGTASLTPKATTTPTCTADAWLSLSAAEGADASCRMPEPRVSGGGATVPGWSSLRSANQDAPGSPDIGMLASSFAGRDQCVAAVGRGAALAAADRDGKVERYFSSPTQAAMSACPVTFVDLGTSAGVAPADIDKAIQPVFTNIQGSATVIITGLSDGTDDEPAPRMLMTVGSGVKRGALTSQSTQQTGFVTAPDVSATVLARLGDQPDGSVGSPLTVRPDRTTPDAEIATDLRAADLKLMRSQDVSLPYVVAAGVLAVLVLGVGAWRWRRRGAPPSWLGPAAVTVASLPVASWLASAVPWWRGGPTTLWFVVAVVVAAALVVSVAYAGPWREWAAGPPLVVAAITLAVMALDVVTGSQLQLIAPQGLQPLLGGRYHGMGNAAFGFFASAALLLGGLSAMRLVWWDDTDETDVRLAAASVGVVGVAAAVVDGHPSWGADLGGPPAILAATAVVVALILRVRPTKRRVALLLLGVLAFVALAAWLDWRRGPGSRSHLGRFVQQIADGEALGVIGDKLAGNVGLLFSSPLALLVPVVLVLAWVAVLRPEGRLGRPLQWLWDELPLLRWVCVGLLVCWSVAFVLNDSGVGVPATGAQLAVPLLVAAAAAAWRDRTAD